MFSLLAQLGIDGLPLSEAGGLGGMGILYLCYLERQRRLKAEDEIEYLQLRNRRLQRRLRVQKKPSVRKKKQKKSVRAVKEKITE